LGIDLGGPVTGYGYINARLYTYMSVVRQDDTVDELIHFVNKLESKIFLLEEKNKSLEKRVRVLEAAAKKHGVKVGNHEVDKDACIIV